MISVILLTTGACALCDEAKASLERVGQDFPLDIDVVPVDTERGKRLAHQAGIAFPPGVIVAGQPFSYGRLSERKLRRHLQRRPPDQP